MIKAVFFDWFNTLARYQQTILTETGINISQEQDILVKIMKKMQQLSQGMSFVLSDDALPTLEILKEQGKTL